MLSVATGKHFMGGQENSISKQGNTSAWRCRLRHSPLTKTFVDLGMSSPMRELLGRRPYRPDGTLLSAAHAVGAERSDPRLNSLISNGRSKKISSIRFAPEFSLFGANYLFPFFLFGLGCSRFRIAKIDFLPIYIAVLVGTSSYAIAGILGYVARTDRVSIIALLLGVSACFSLLLSGWKNRTLAFIGFYSYTIYLFHVFFTASTRMFLYSMNLKNITALVIVATVAGVVGPILVEMIADRFALTRTPLLGRAGLAGVKTRWRRMHVRRASPGKITSASPAVCRKEANLEL
jgi:hypothetical protein